MSGVNKTGGVLTSIVITEQCFDNSHDQITYDDGSNKFLHTHNSFPKDKDNISIHQMGGE